MEGTSTAFAVCFSHALLSATGSREAQICYMGRSVQGMQIWYVHFSALHEFYSWAAFE